MFRWFLLFNNALSHRDHEGAKLKNEVILMQIVCSDKILKCAGAQLIQRFRILLMNLTPFRRAYLATMKGKIK
jgi:hypothetical protein